MASAGKSARSARGRRTYAYSRGVVGSRPCPVCRTTPLTGRQEVCSGKCRVARSRQRQAEAAQERDRQIREYLVMAQESLEAIRGLLRDAP
jgi:predicted nucleic acid-binding Zn ribbon protein